MQKAGLTILGLVLLAAPAMADPRDDALAAIQRCAGVSDPDARLACFDGMVARYRMDRVAAPAPAQAPLPPPTYVPPPPPPVVRPAAPPPQALRRTGVFGSIFGKPERYPQTTVQQFGSEGLKSRGELSLADHQPGDIIDAISGRVIAYRLDQDERLVVTLDNGQDWLQILGGEHVEMNKPASAYAAEIRRDPNGAYVMRLTGIAKVIYVRRRR